MTTKQHNIFMAYRPVNFDEYVRLPDAQVTLNESSAASPLVLAAALQALASISSKFDWVHEIRHVQNTNLPAGLPNTELAYELKFTDHVVMISVDYEG